MCNIGGREEFRQSFILEFPFTKVLAMGSWRPPSLPYSAYLYQKQQQLLNFCEVIWPRNSKLRREGWYFLSSIWVAFLMLFLTGLPYFGVLIQNFTVALYDCLIEAAVSSIPALRHLAMEGIMLPLFRKLPSPI